MKGKHLSLAVGFANQVQMQIPAGVAVKVEPGQGEVTGRIVIVTLLLDSMGVEAIPFAFAVTAACEAVLMGAILAWKMRRRIGGPTPLPMPA